MSRSSKLQPYHDVSSMCGEGNTKYAIDHIKIDATNEQLVATNGKIAVFVPVTLGDCPDGILVSASVLAKASSDSQEIGVPKNGKTGNPFPYLGAKKIKQPENAKFPNLDGLFPGEPDLIVGLPVREAKLLFDYAETHGAKSVMFMVKHNGAKDWQSRRTEDAVRFFVDVTSEDDKATVSGVITPSFAKNNTQIISRVEKNLQAATPEKSDNVNKEKDGKTTPSATTKKDAISAIQKDVHASVVPRKPARAGVSISDMNTGQLIERANRFVESGSLKWAGRVLARITRSLEASPDIKAQKLADKLANDIEAAGSAKRTARKFTPE